MLKDYIEWLSLLEVEHGLKNILRSEDVKIRVSHELKHHILRICWCQDGEQSCQSDDLQCVDETPQVLKHPGKD